MSFGVSPVNYSDSDSIQVTDIDFFSWKSTLPTLYMDFVDSLFPDIEEREDTVHYNMDQHVNFEYDSYNQRPETTKCKNWQDETTCYPLQRLLKKKKSQYL